METVFSNGKKLSDFKNGVADIGQFSKDDKKQLDKLFRQGKIGKYFAQWCPPLAVKKLHYILL